MHREAIMLYAPIQPSEFVNIFVQAKRKRSVKDDPRIQQLSERLTDIIRPGKDGLDEHYIEAVKKLNSFCAELELYYDELEVVSTRVLALTNSPNSTIEDYKQISTTMLNIEQKIGNALRNIDQLALTFQTKT